MWRLKKHTYVSVILIRKQKVHNALSNSVNADNGAVFNSAYGQHFSLFANGSGSKYLSLAYSILSFSTSFVKWWVLCFPALAFLFFHGLSPSEVLRTWSRWRSWLDIGLSDIADSEHWTQVHPSFSTGLDVLITSQIMDAQ